MTKSRPATSDAELDVLKTLWDHGPGTVREIQDRLSAQRLKWKRSTVITLLQRLERKGYVESDKSQFAFVFRPAVTLDAVLHERMSQLARELADGDAVPLVLAFAERHQFTDEEIRRFRQIIDQAEVKRP